METSTTKTSTEIILTIVGWIFVLIPSVLAWLNSVKTSKRQQKMEEEEISRKRTLLPLEVKGAAGEAADKVASGYGQLVDDLQTQINDLKATVEALKSKDADKERRIKYLENGVRTLVRQIKDAGGCPQFDINGNGVAHEKASGV